MLFPTIEFAIFFAIVFALSSALQSRNTIRKLFLTFVSYIFYGFWDWRFIFLLAGFTVLNYIGGLVIDVTRHEHIRRIAFSLAIALNISTLGYFKYYDFLAAELANLAAMLELNLDINSSGVPLPVAISFLTFHAISYLTDIYRRTIAATRSPIDLALYFSFFPHLVAGPIVKAHDFLGQLLKSPSRATIRFGHSSRLILFGLFKKVVIAGNLSILIVDPVFQTPSEFSQFDLLLAAYAYALVIYCDFSAYTDIAIGVADLLGYKFPQNFNQPYRAASLQDFWRRWHMTLSGWLKDYVYIPLGGNRTNIIRAKSNLLLTMVLGGIWHGAGMQFIVWGFWHGLGLVVESSYRRGKSEPANILKTSVSTFLVFHFVVIGWIFFRSPDLETALIYLQSLAFGQGHISIMTPTIIALIAVGAISQFTPLNWVERIDRYLDNASSSAMILIAVSIITLISLFAPPGIPPFIYFQF